MSPGLVDFHCHLDLYSDFEAAIAAAEAAKVYTLTVTTTPKAWPRNRDFTANTRYVRAALGLHPQLIAQRANELPLLEKYLNETRYIGEVGLDARPHYYEFLDLQKQVFKRILTCCADAGGKILTVHSVRSATAVLDHIQDYLPASRGRIVLHWFTGSLKEASRAVELGCFFSINVKMAETKKGKDLITHLPLDRILTETDNPFINKPNSSLNTPSDLSRAINAIAAIRCISVKETEASIKKNFIKLLN